MSFQPIFGSYLLVALLAAGLWALLAIRPPTTGALTPLRRRVLAWLRFASFAAVVLAMLRPTFVRTEDRVEPAKLVILADQSRSMSVADQSNYTRWQVIRNTLQAVQPVITELADVLDVQLYEFDSRARPVPSKDGKYQLPDEPTGDQTDVAGALADVIADQAANRLAAVILLSDGAQRVSVPRVGWQEPARELARRGVPLFTVAIGQGREQSQARDVAVASMPDQFTVFTGNQLAIRASIMIQGYAERAIPVELTIRNEEGDEVHRETQSVRVNDETRFADVTFVYVPEKAGEYRITVRAAPQPDEQVTDNNELGAYLRVLDGGVRVLYLDGNPGWQEQKFIRRAIETAPDVDLDYVWIDVRHRANWPIDLSKFLQQQRYDVLLLGDVHAIALGNKSLELIARRTDQGMGLMMTGGTRSFGPGGYGRLTGLMDVLPVRLSEYEMRSLESNLDPQQHVMGELTPIPTDHFITAIGGDSAERWQQLPPFAGANLLKPTEAARVLISARPTDSAGTTDEYPILIAGEYGRGRVLALAVDSTFRWYRHGFRQEHMRFWRQAMLWLARKDQAESSEVWIDLPLRRLPGGSSVTFQAGVRGPDGNPVAGAELSASITRVPSDGDDETGPAIQLQEQPDAWSGTSDPIREAGEYQLRVQATKDGTELGSATARFLVTTQDLELADPAANPRQLAMLAAQTEEAGGKPVAAEQVGEVLAEVARQRREQKIQFQQRWQLGDTALDAWVYFLVLIALLSTEWYLRKRWSLA